MSELLYTDQQITLGLALLHIHVDPPLTDGEARHAIRKVVDVRAESIGSFEGVPDSLGDYRYDPSHRGDCTQLRRLIVLHRLFHELHPDGALWADRQCDQVKREARAVLCALNLPLARRIEAARSVIRADYARSARTSLTPSDLLSFLWHPGLDEYIRHHLHSSPVWARFEFGDEVFCHLCLLHPKPEVLRIRDGSANWGTAS